MTDIDTSTKGRTHGDFAPVHSHSYFLTAGECNAEGRMPVTLAVERVIEVATEHANSLGIGYDELIKKNIGWVLSRLVIEIYHYPAINGIYTLSTWIEDYNRHFSLRNFALRDGAGRIIGYARSVWSAIDFEQRRVADLTAFEQERFPLERELECPIAPPERMRALGNDAAVENYRFRYCDLDFNRHVNTVRYLALILNHWSLEHHDAHDVRRLDMSFHTECHYGEDVQLRVADEGKRSLCEIVREGTRAVGAVITWD